MKYFTPYELKLISSLKRCVRRINTGKEGEEFRIMLDPQSGFTCRNLNPAYPMTPKRRAAIKGSEITEDIAFNYVNDYTPGVETNNLYLFDDCKAAFIEMFITKPWNIMHCDIFTD